MKTYVKHLGYAALAGLMVSGIAYAATQSVTANARFDSALTLVKNADINFGMLEALQAGTYVIDTAGVITASAGGVVVGGTPAFGQITITGSANQTIAIRTNGYTPNNGVDINTATCEYDGGAIANCDVGGFGLAAPGGGAGKVLKLGVKIIADGNQAANTTAAPTFVVNVIYG